MEKELERCLAFAKSVGVPKDQAENLISHGYVPYPWQWKFHAACREADKKGGPVRIGLGGARGPGKSHAEFSQLALDDAQRCPGLKGLFLRQTGKAAKESFDDLVAKIVKNKIKYELTSNVLRFSNGSRILLGGFKDDRDIDKYVGIEYDAIAIEEGNQITGERKNKLRGSLRTSKENWRPRWYESFNPGGVGHSDVKAVYVEPYRSGLETDTRFVPSTFRDNPNLNLEYVEYLESLDGQLGKAWRDGDFDILAGQYFTEWNEDIHVITPFSIPETWKNIAFLDYGLTNPSALYWASVNGDNQLHLYRELYGTGMTYSKLAEEFVAMTPPNERIDYLVADPSIWNKDGRNDLGLSGAEIFQNRYKELTGKSIQLVRGDNDRITGWGMVREYLRPFVKDGKITAKLQVFDTCPNFIRTIVLQIHDENRNPEDLDTNVEDHAMDSLRYGIMSRPKAAITTEQLGKIEFAQAMRRKKLLQGRSREAKTLFV